MDSITINFSKSPELKELFTQKKVGDKCSFEVEMQVNEITPDEASGSIEKITFESHDEEEKEVEPDAKEPAMIEMKIGDEKMPMEPASY